MISGWLMVQATIHTFPEMAIFLKNVIFERFYLMFMYQGEIPVVIKINI